MSNDSILTAIEWQCCGYIDYTTKMNECPKCGQKNFLFDEEKKVDFSIPKTDLILENKQQLEFNLGDKNG